MIHQGRKGSFQGEHEGRERIREILANSNFSTEAGVEAFRARLQECLEHDKREGRDAPVRVRDQLRQGRSPEDVYDFLHGLSYLKPRFELRWQGKPLDRLSPGARGNLLLVFYLLIDRRDVPLIIDQPEDNLDNGRGSRMETLSDRRNIVVIADEAHRSQYDIIDGFARHMRDALPNASFIGFTGTPIELTDKNTRAVFGDYISVYDIQRAVEDKATVPIYYESRLAKLELDEAEKPRIDPEFEEVTEGEEVERKEKLKSKWAQLEAVGGAEKRLKLIAQDMVAHFEQRLEAMDGKAMVVCMSRRICVERHREIVALRPAWRHDEDDKGAIKVVMTGSASDALDWQPHIRNKPRREALANRFRDATDPLKLVLVRDMWLTGFDAPSLHTAAASACLPAGRRSRPAAPSI